MNGSTNVDVFNSLIFIDLFVFYKNKNKLKGVVFYKIKNKKNNDRDYYRYLLLSITIIGKENYVYLIIDIFYL